MTGPAPDLSGYPATDDDVYEWLLSDHPWARTERQRRAQDRYREETTRAVQIRQWTDTLDQLGSGVSSGKLTGLLGLSADESWMRAEVRSARPEDTAVQDDRKAYERERRARGEDYRHPAHLVGSNAVNTPPPHPRAVP